MTDAIKKIFSKMDFFAAAPDTTQNCTELKQKIYVLGASIAIPALSSFLTSIGKFACSQVLGKFTEENSLSSNELKSTNWVADKIMILPLVIATGVVTQLLIRWASTIPPRPVSKEILILESVFFPFTELKPLQEGNNVQRIAIEENNLNVLNLTRPAQIKMCCSDLKERTFPNIVAATLAQQFDRYPDLIDQFTECKDWRSAIVLSNENQAKINDYWKSSYFVLDGGKVKLALSNKCDYWLFISISSYFQQHPYALKSLQEVPMNYQLEHFNIKGDSKNTFTQLNKIILNIRNQLSFNKK